MEKEKLIESARKHLWKTIMFSNNHNHEITLEKIYSVAYYDSWVICRDLYSQKITDYKEYYKVCRDLVEKYATEIKELIGELLLKLEKINTKHKINQITAQAILEPIMDQTGLKYYIEYQKTGIVIYVQLIAKKKAKLYMSYSRVRNESHKLINNILILKQMYSYFGHNSVINQIYRDEEKLFKKGEE